MLSFETMRPVALAVITLVSSCGHDDAGRGVDAGGGVVDASTDASQNPPDPPYNGICTLWVGASCSGADATIHLGWSLVGSSASMCRLPKPDDRIASCADGCTIENAWLGFTPQYIQAPDYLRAIQPSSLCAGTPGRMLGDACDPQTDNCLPTYSALASDGTVAGHTYLQCDAPSRTCVERTPPVIRDYLARCSDDVIARYGRPDVSGAVLVFGDFTRACLLAWDAAAMTTRSGVTEPCIGDWMCPSGSICDDQTPGLQRGGSATTPVCKPGPRGVIDPATLSP